MNFAVPDEPEQAEEPDEDRQQQHYNEMYARQYENDHTWEQLQEDEYGNLRMVGNGTNGYVCLGNWATRVQGFNLSSPDVGTN